MKAVDHAYQSLRVGILAGHYEFGGRLNEVDTAESLGVSRTPVREALRRLSAEGLVELLPNRGARVATWTVRDLEEVYDLRACMESYGTAQAVRYATTEDLDYLAKLCDKEEAVITDNDDDVETVLDVKADYHRALMRLSGNQRLYELVTPLIEVQNVLRTFRSYPRERLLHQMNEHRMLVKAFRVGDGEWAAAIMRAHLTGAKETLLEDKRRSEEVARTELGD